MHVLILFDSEVGSLGGGESVMHGLVRGLSAIDRGDDRFTILCPPGMASDMAAWLRPGITAISRPQAPASVGGRFRSAFGPLRRPLGRTVRRVLGRAEQQGPVAPPPLDSFVHEQRADVIHFMMPLHYATGAPRAVFTIHDLQHEHFPEYFHERNIRLRRQIFKAVRDCQALVAISNFTANDFQRREPVPREKLFTIPWASYIEPDHENTALSPKEQERLTSLPREFIFYPAYSYGHKNHVRLLDSLSLIEREHGLRIPLVCTGGRNHDWEPVLAHWRSLSPRPSLIDLGYTSRTLLLALYRHARFVVFPTLFEGAGLPILEAMRLGRPIACSDIPPFREFGGHGPIFFDPQSAVTMAEALRPFWEDAEARSESIARSTLHQSAELTWERCARSYLAVYRYAAGVDLPDEDRQILDSCRFGRPALAANRPIQL